MSTYSEQINAILQDNLIPKMRVLSMDIAKYEPYSYTSTTLEDRRRQLDYYSMLYDFLYEYATGSEELTSAKLTNIVRLLEPPSREKKSFNWVGYRPIEKPYTGFKFYVNDLEVTDQTLLEPGTLITITVKYVSYTTIPVGAKRMDMVQPAVASTSGTTIILANYLIPYSLAGSVLPVEVELYIDGNFYTDRDININVGYMTTNKVFYYGVGAVGLTPAQIQGLTMVIEPKSSKTFKFSPDSEVFYFAYPASYGLLTSILDHNGFDMISDFLQTTENFTLAIPNYPSGIQSYYVYEYDMITIQNNFNITFNF